MKAKSLWALMAMVAGFWCFHQGSAMPSEQLMKLLSLKPGAPADAQSPPPPLVITESLSGRGTTDIAAAALAGRGAGNGVEATDDQGSSEPRPPHFGLYRAGRASQVPAEVSASQTPLYARTIQPGTPGYDELAQMIKPGQTSLVVGDTLLIPHRVNGELIFSEYSLEEARFIYHNPEMFVDKQLTMFMADQMMGPWSENWGMDAAPGVDPVFQYCRDAGCIFRATYDSAAEARAYVRAFRDANPGLLVNPISWEGNLVVTYLDLERSVALYDADGLPTVPEFGPDGRPMTPLFDGEGNPVDLTLPFPPELAEGGPPPPLPPELTPGPGVVMPPHLIDGHMEQEPPFLPVVPPHPQSDSSALSADATWGNPALPSPHTR